MTKTDKTISSGVVRQIPNDLETLLAGDKSALVYWEDITPLARRVEDAKKAETRDKRLARVLSDLKGEKTPLLLPRLFTGEKELQIKVNS